MIYLRVQPDYTTVYNIPYGSTTESAIQARTYFMVPGYERDIRYETRVWDGKEQLFLRARDTSGQACHRLLTGLLPRLVGVLDVRQEPYEFIDKLVAWVKNPAMAYLQAAKFSVRDYQVHSVMALTKRKPYRLGGVLQVATGGGKTRIAAKAMQFFQCTTVFLVNQVDLLEQAADDFAELLGCPIGRVGGGNFDIQDITVATIQTVALAAGDNTKALAADKKLDYIKLAEIMHMMQSAHMVFVDECHGVAARTARAVVLAASNTALVVGLSASPWRDDGMDILIEGACGPVVYVKSASELIDAGWLIAPHIYIHKMPLPADSMFRNNNAMKFHELYADWVVKDVKRNNYVAALANQHVAKGQVVIVLVKSVDHGKILQGLIPKSLYMHGKVTKKKRKAILEDVKSGSTRVLIATSLADQGLDLPIASVVILAGGGKSSTKALQRIGRVLRLHPEKTTAFVHDIVDQHANLERQYRERLRIYRTEPRFMIHEHKVT